jgi:hypothetical protein
MVLGDYNPINNNNPRKIKVGKIVDREGINMNVVVEVDHPREGNYRVWLEPTRKGKESKAYREMRQILRDDWSSDITDSWYEPTTIKSLKLRQNINKVVEDLRKKGYRRY